MSNGITELQTLAKWSMIAIAVTVFSVSIGAAITEYSKNQIELAKIQYECKGGNDE